MAAITGLPAPTQATSQGATEAGEKKGEIAKADAVFQQIDFDHSQKCQRPSLRETAKICAGGAIVAGVLVLTFFVTRAGLQALAHQKEGTICKPTVSPAPVFQSGIQLGLLLPQSLPPQQLFVPAKEVQDKVDLSQGHYETIDEMLQAVWHKYSDWEKEEAQTGFKNTIGAAVRAKVVCLTGEPFNPQSWHMTVAKFLALPYTGGSEMYTAFNAVRALNENFNNQTISDPLFISICEEFSNQAWFRDKKYSLNDDREWVLNDFKPWMSAVQQVIDVYTKPMRNALFSELAPYAQEVLGINDLQKFDVAPVRTQIMALDQVRTSAIAQLNKRTSGESHKDNLFMVLSQSSYFLSHLRAAELTGNSYYERTVTQNPFMIDDYQEIAAGLFNHLYQWNGVDGNENYQFNFIWDNGLKYYVSHPETVFKPYSEGFTPQSTANLLALLKSEALRLNNTATHIDGPATIDLTSTIELIDQGVT